MKGPDLTGNRNSTDVSSIPWGSDEEDVDVTIEARQGDIKE